MLTLRRQTEDCNDDILPAHGASVGFGDEPAAEPYSDEARLAELAAIEAERDMNVIWNELAASRDRVWTQAQPAGADDVAVQAIPTFDGRGRDLVYWVFIHMGGKVYSGHSEDLASAETQALLRASIADVAARKGVTA